MTLTKIILIFGAICMAFVAVIPHILWLIGWIVSLFTHHTIRYAPFGWTALGLAVAVALLLAYGFYIGRWLLCVEKVSYHNTSVPQAFEGFRIVHISDLHLNTFNDQPDMLKRFMEEINAQNPDVVCFTGDLVTMGREEAEPYSDILRSVKARYGVVSVLGNHDFMIYNRQYKSETVREEAVDLLADYERNTLGWTLLRDSSMVITAADGSKLTIIGVDNKNCSNQGFQTINRGDLAKAMENTKGFRILLSHDPSHWDAEVLGKTDIQLTLSGHTHASQITIFGWSPASLLFRRASGRYDENGQTIYVNPGLGCTAPFRIGARPEVTLITIEK